MNIKKFLSELPHSPGVYRMFDKDDHLIYVGKAKDLKKRVSSYFRKSAKHTARVQKMVSLISSIQYTTVHSEVEALVLETSYIKEQQPKYNILMRDDKHYLYIKVTNDEDYPRVYTVRRVSKDNAHYFGPKTNSQSVYRTLKLLRKIFPYRSCNLGIEDQGDNVVITKKTISYPCLYYHIKRCIGPCVVSCKPEYDHIIQGIIAFLKGDYKDIQQALQASMLKAAEQKQFEKAAEIRDTLSSIDQLMEKQVIDQANIRLSQDVIGISHRLREFYISMLQIRNGRIIGEEYFTMKAPSGEESKEDIMEQFLLQHYAKTTEPPKDILLPFALPEKATLEAYLLSTCTQKVTILTPQKGTKKELIQRAYEAAEQYAIKQHAHNTEKFARTKGALRELAKALDLPELPKRIECYDISHISGTHTVASMVVFEDGKPSKSQYRRFKIKHLTPGQIDDFESMKEVLHRRTSYLGKHTDKKNSSFSQAPDLIIIDGGKGQLSHAMEHLEKDMVPVPFVSLAKREEEIFLPGSSDPVILERDSKVLYLVQNIRDEAHRFAISYNRNLRSKAQKKSILDGIKGVGPKMKKKLLSHFGDIRGIEQASYDEIAKVTNAKVATSIKEIL